jgi:hypothetical protein
MDSKSSTLGATIHTRYKNMVKKAKGGKVKRVPVKVGSEWEASLPDKLILFLKTIEEYQPPLDYMKTTRQTGFDVILAGKRVSRDIRDLLVFIAMRESDPELVDIFGELGLLHKRTYTTEKTIEI